MADDEKQGRVDTRRLGPAGWFALVVLAGFLAGAVLYAVHAWRSVADVPMGFYGWLFMTLGAVVTFLVGAALMGLVFYSSRHGRDI